MCPTERLFAGGVTPDQLQLVAAQREPARSASLRACVGSHGAMEDPTLLKEREVTFR